MGVKTVNRLDGYDKTIVCPPDKSVSVRAVILGAYAVGRTTVRNLSLCADVLSAVDCMRRLGADIKLDGTTAYIAGAPFHGAKLDCGNSATVARLLAGLLSGLNGVFELTGDESLLRRPMARVIEPLVAMGARIQHTDGKLPVKIIGSPLKGTEYALPVPSAQVKSALILAGLNAVGRTRVVQPVAVRDHTERMLAAMGGDINVDGNAVEIGQCALRAVETEIPGDVSSAAYPICVALCTGGKCTVKNVGANPTRTGLFDVLKSIGADMIVENRRVGVEPLCDVTVRGGRVLRPLVVDGRTVARVIDEIPALCALACFIDGISVIDGADELRVKECDRIKATVSALRSLGADITETEHGMIINGGKRLSFGTVDPCGDHRIAMAAAVAACAGNGADIIDAECVGVSYPNFFKEIIDVE